MHYELGVIQRSSEAYLIYYEPWSSDCRWTPDVSFAVRRQSTGNAGHSTLILDLHLANGVVLKADSMFKVNHE